MVTGKKQYRFLDLLINIFIVVLIVSNLIAPKMVAVGHLPFTNAPLLFSAAQILFPITYIFGDVFTEVYGFSASRRAIWTGLLASCIVIVIGTIAIALPPAPVFKDQDAYEKIFGVLDRKSVV